MPTEAKLGLVLGIGLTITLAILFRPAQTSDPHPPTAQIKPAPELQGQPTSSRK